ncbi:MAG: alpha-2-macroglobulin family protein [Chitinophagaceae bacterium]|nr:alpha-2-macroglobulin family protein [Chitinophagaceae bacterium]
MRIRSGFTTTTLLAALFSAFLMTSCNRSTVSLQYTNARDEVPALGNLVFRFDQDLVKDSLLDRWDSTQYISFEPKIPGRFRWEHPDELVFSPAQPLTPATSFKATLKNDILQYSSYGRINKGADLVFHTPDLKLDNTNTSWVLQDENSTTAVPQVDLQFNYPVNPNSLKEKLQIAVEGQPVSYTLQTLSTDDKITVRLLNLKMEDKNKEAVISIDKGLVPEGGVNGLKEKLESKSTIPSPFVLQINDVNTEHDGTTGTIKVLTSQQVVAANLASFIKLDPAVKFTVEPSENGFIISSDNFDQSKSYALTLTKGLRGRIGGVLHEEYNTNITFGELAPSVSFVNSKGVYLSGKGAQNIEVKIINVPKVKVIVSKIYENNLLMAQRYGYTPKETNRPSSGDGDEEGGYDYGGYDNGGDVTMGDVIYEQEVDTRSLPKSGNNRLFNFSIADKLPEFKGIYHIMIRSVKDYWVRDNRFVSLSDIGLIAREGSEKMLVFANSIKTAAALAGVNVLAYGANNQLLGMGATNADGVAEIAYTRKDLAGFKPAMIIAKTADDFNYLPFGTTKVNTSRFEVGGRHSNTTGLDAFIYPERDIYRPGEKLNFSVIIRDRQWKAPGELPVKLKFLLPNGKELKTFRKSLNEQGSLEGSMDIAQSAITGSYSLEVYTSNDVLLATQPFRIEEFVPDRIKVTAKLDKPFLEAGDIARLSIHAVNFFGPPAANRKYEYEVQTRQKTFNPKNYRNYNFSLANQSTLFNKDTKEGKTDEQGNAVEKYEVPEMYKNLGLLQTTFFATVFDETGRPVSRSTSVDIYTQPVYFGVSDDGYSYYALNQAIQFPLIALDRDEKVLNGASARVQVIKREYRTVLTKSGSYFRYESQQETKVIASSLVTISGESTRYSFVPRSPGDYELRVSIPGANAYVSRSFYSYGSWGGDNTSFEVNNEGHIDIDLDKDSYYTGEPVKAHFKTPFSGRMLVTMETDKVVSYQYVNVDKRDASLDLPLSVDDIPNVYITATLIKPHELSDIPLTVAHGYQSVKVEEKDRRIAVSIEAQKAVRSHTHQKVRVKAAAGSMVTLAAVDNGVLQISSFETPDPYTHFYAKRALEVNGYDLYPLLFPEVRPSLSSTGGDAEGDMKKRVNPMPAKRIKIVSYWSGIAKANGSGEAEFEFDIPQFSGEVRLMALAYKDQRFGASSSTMTVADPIVLSSALPRFLSPGDTVTMPVTITNTTNSAASAEARLKVSGAVRVAGDDHMSLSVAAGSEGRAVFQLVAPPTIGTGKISVDVAAMGEHFTDETEIGVRPSAPLQKITDGGAVTGGASQTINWNAGDFIPSSVDYQLLVSRSPVIELSKYLNWLVEYPYGCTEQTVSAAFPQLYYSDLADLMRQGNAASRASANSNVQEAIRKIKMRQLYSGAVTLWDNEGTENWWATIYSAHFLLEAQKAGFDVDKGLLETMLGYINSRLKNRETITYYYNRDQNKKIAPKEVAYGLYVLSLAGRPNVSVMNYYKANPGLLSLDAKYLLSAAYALSGDKKSFKEFLPSQFAGEESVAQTGGSFYSDIRDESIALNVLVDADPDNPQIQTMVRHISAKLKQRYWYTTQELAFSFLGMGKVARREAGSTATADVKVDGRTVGSMNGSPLKLSSKDLKGSGSGVPKVEIVTRGSGKVYYFWQVEGISATGAYKEEDSYLKVRKRFFDRNGRPIAGNTFHQNDLVIVQITLEKTYSTDIDNVVITDMLPAGFEIENPRTKDIPGMDWIKDAETPTALDVRDDRINFFVNQRSNRQTYYYAVRAVSPGIYRMGPVGADAMYNGEYHSYNGAGTVKVVQ